MITCEICNRTFESSWSDEEAIIEATKNFGSPPPPGKGVTVCESCYQKAMTHAKAKNWPMTW